MIIDFNKLNLRQANQKRYHKQWAPEGMQPAWPHALDCGHTHVLTAAQIESIPKEGDAILCSSCAKGDRTGFGDHGFCTRTVFHRPVVIGDPIFVPLNE
jgi:hypothetical protein